MMTSCWKHPCKRHVAKRLAAHVCACYNPNALYFPLMFAGTSTGVLLRFSSPVTLEDVVFGLSVVVLVVLPLSNPVTLGVRFSEAMFFASVSSAMDNIIAFGFSVVLVLIPLSSPVTLEALVAGELVELVLELFLSNVGLALGFSAAMFFPSKSVSPDGTGCG